VSQNQKERLLKIGIYGRIKTQKVEEIARYATGKPLTSPKGDLVRGVAPKTPRAKDKENRMANRTRNKAVTLRMTEEEYIFFQKQMEIAQQKNQTDFFLAVLRKKKITVVENLKPMLAELKRQGNNLNQIARQLNEGTEFGQSARKVMNECWKAYSALISLSEVK
jgi:hypothetical protein